MKAHIVASLALCLPAVAQAAQQCALPAAAPAFTVADNWRQTRSADAHTTLNDAIHCANAPIPE